MFHICEILRYNVSMQLNNLLAVGLSKSQAEAYVLLIELGEVKPVSAASKLSISRTNAYKIYDKLVEFGLATKTENEKIFVYRPTNPLSLATLAANHRAESVLKEEAASNAIHELLDQYYEHTDKPTVDVYTGRTEVANAYRKQIGLKEDIRFIHTNADIPAMNFETMHELRVQPARNNNKREAIMKRPQAGKENWASHQRSNLDITFRDQDDYEAPVEWSVTESSLLIVLYANEPHAIFIQDKVVASAFIQIFKLLKH